MLWIARSFAALSVSVLATLPVSADVPTAQDFVDGIRTFCAIKHTSTSERRRCGERQVEALLWFKKLQARNLSKKQEGVALKCWSETGNKWARDWVAARTCYQRRAGR